MMNDKITERDALVTKFKAGSLTEAETKRLLVLEAMFSGGIKNLLDTEEQKDRWFEIRRKYR
jgi:hypothetical protein